MNARHRDLSLPDSVSRDSNTYHPGDLPPPPPSDIMQQHDYYLPSSYYHPMYNMSSLIATPVPPPVAQQVDLNPFPFDNGQFSSSSSRATVEQEISNAFEELFGSEHESHFFSPCIISFTFFSH